MTYIQSAFTNIYERIERSSLPEDPKRAIKLLEGAVRKQMSAEAIASPGGSRERREAGLWLSSSWGRIACTIIVLMFVGAVAGTIIGSIIEPTDTNHLSGQALCKHQWENIAGSTLYGTGAGAGLGLLIFLVAKIVSYTNPHVKERLRQEVQLQLTHSNQNINNNCDYTLTEINRHLPE